MDGDSENSDQSDDNLLRFKKIKIIRRSSMTMELKNMTDKTLMYKVHSQPRTGPNHPISGLLLPGKRKRTFCASTLILLNVE